MQRLDTSNLAYADARGVEEQYDTQAQHGAIAPGESVPLANARCTARSCVMLGILGAASPQLR